MGVEDPWNTMVYLSSIPVPPHIKQLLVEGALKSEGVSDSSPSHIRNSRGRAALENRGLCEGLLAWSIDIELDESIVVWHIVTDLYLCWFKKQAKSSGRQDDTELLDLAKVIEAVEALSNYMMFLLAARPYMLPPPTSRNAYVHVCCYSLTSVKCRTPEDLILNTTMLLLQPAVLLTPHATRKYWIKDPSLAQSSWMTSLKACVLLKC